MGLLQRQAAPKCFCNFVPLVRRCPGMRASWERGRPARTMPPAALELSSTRIDRERRHGSPSAWPMLSPPTGWLTAASQESSAAAKGTACGRDARAPRQKADAGGEGRQAAALGDARSLQHRSDRLKSCGSGGSSGSFLSRGGNLFPLRVFLRGPSRTPFESFPTPWNSFVDKSFPDYA